MNSLVQQLNSLGDGFVGFALPMLIQSSVLIMLLLLVESALRNRVRASLRCWLLMLAFAHLIVMPLLSAPVGGDYWPGSQVAYGQTLTKTVDSVTVSAGEASPGRSLAIAYGVGEPRPALTWQAGLFLLWAASVVVMTVLLIRRTVAARERVRTSRSANLLMNDILAYCRKCLGVREPVKLRVSRSDRKPTVCGLLEPVILVPDDLAPTLGARHLRAVLFHHLAHVRRCDLWLNWIQAFLQIAYFYNPFVWIASAVLHRTREQAADEAVLEAVGEKERSYRQLLDDVANLVVGRSSPAPAPVGLASR